MVHRGNNPKSSLISCRNILFAGILLKGRDFLSSIMYIIQSVHCMYYISYHALYVLYFFISLLYLVTLGRPGAILNMFRNRVKKKDHKGLITYHLARICWPRRLWPGPVSGPLFRWRRRLPSARPRSPYAPQTRAPCPKTHPSYSVIVPLLAARHFSIWAFLVLAVDFSR